MSAESDFVARLKPFALMIQFETGIKAIIPITQAAHESRWGQSDLAVKANNLFGFTGESWARAKKPVVYMKTREFVKGKWITVERPFRAYDSWEGSVRDWADVMHFPRYRQALMWAKEEHLGAWARAVYAAGYATDPNYPEKLIAIGRRVAPLLAPAV